MVALREFPAILKGELIGIPSIIFWQEYLGNGTIEVQGEYWQFCGQSYAASAYGHGTPGVAEGNLLDGVIEYDIALPTPNLASNEAYLSVTEDSWETFQTFVLTHDGQSAVMVPVTEYGTFGAYGATILVRAKGPMEFNVYDNSEQIIESFCASR